MDIKDYLSQAIRIEKVIDSQFSEINRLRELSKRIKTCTFEEHNGGSGNREPGFVRCIDKISEYEEKIAIDTQKLIQLKEEIESVISILDSNDEKLILRYRYFNGLNWEMIGNHLHMSDRNARRIHDKAIRKIEKEMSA